MTETEIRRIIVEPATKKVLVQMVDKKEIEGRTYISPRIATLDLDKDDDAKAFLSAIQTKVE